MIKLSLLFFVFCFMFLKPIHVGASDFYTTGVTTYKYTDQGLGTSQTKLEIKNIKSEHLSKGVKIFLSKNIKDITISDDVGVLPYTVFSELDSDQFDIDITRPVAGKSKSKSLYITHPVDSIKTSGNVSEIDIQNSGILNSFDSGSTFLEIPINFGYVVGISPPPDAQIESNFLHQISWNSHLSNIHIALSTSKVYSFNLAFEKLPVIFPGSHSEFFPIIKSIDPPPTQIYINKDENYELEYAKNNLPKTVIISGLAISSTDPSSLFRQFATLVDVAGAQYVSQDIAPSQIRLSLNTFLIPAITNYLSLTITNPNGILTPSQTLLVNEQTFTVPKLAPYGSVVISIPLKFKSLLPPTPYGIVAILGSKTVAYNIGTNSFIIWYAAISIFIVIIIFFFSVLATKAWHLYLQKHKK